MLNRRATRGGGGEASPALKRLVKICALFESFVNFMFILLEYFNVMMKIITNTSLF